ncbi:hypothetical protein JCM24511_01300 [Saitozyma sp. JCM 24511]|nr:hypothetical protein JCM24511_01300 [Saitozyma sp. JCM 24511]
MASDPDISMPADDAPLPIRVGRRGRPSKSRDNARSRQAGTHAVGGGLVGSMKRGLAVRRPSKLECHRTTLLLGIALILFVVLSWGMIRRVDSRVRASGGWAGVTRGFLRQLVGEQRDPKPDL